MDQLTISLPGGLPNAGGCGIRHFPPTSNKFQWDYTLIQHKGRQRIARRNHRRLDSPHLFTAQRRLDPRYCVLAEVLFAEVDADSAIPEH